MAFFFIDRRLIFSIVLILLVRNICPTQMSVFVGKLMPSRPTSFAPKMQLCCVASIAIRWLSIRRDRQQNLSWMNSRIAKLRERVSWMTPSVKTWNRRSVSVTHSSFKMLKTTIPFSIPCWIVSFGELVDEFSLPLEIRISIFRLRLQFSYPLAIRQLNSRLTFALASHLSTLPSPGVRCRASVSIRCSKQNDPILMKSDRIFSNFKVCIFCSLFE